ncbi:copper transport protein [Nocardioides exalbidus]|uniref:Copper transport protein n=1 Tax=Nocardioides exalbidus TaxID=402596 RepID=A0A1H4UXZ9_9ACTN|nr:FixH family protein [Nocardioides exalbidus]SEC73268.1 copper transport protein [Nocardioides exalbidus]
MTDPHPRRPRRRLPHHVVVRLLAALLVPLASFLVLGTAAPASAHATLVSTDPAEGAVLDAAPDQVTFTFNEAVIGVPTGIQVFDATGEVVASKATVREAELVVELEDEVGEGTLVVVWRLVSADGHPIGGSLTFSVGEPSATVAVPETSADAGTDAPFVLSLVRWLGYLGLLAAAGLAAFYVLLLPRDAPEAGRHRLRAVARGGALVAIVAFWVAVPLVALYQLGLPTSALGDGSTWATLSTWEYAVPAAVAVGLALAVGVLPAGAPDRARAGLALVGCAVALAAPSMTGHTRATTPEALVIAVDVLHLVAGATWLGGLLAIGLVLRDLTGRDDSGAVVLARFSTWASALLALLVITGTFMAWRVAGSWDALLETGYGSFLLVKVLIVLVAIVIAAWNRFALLPNLQAASGEDRVGAASVLVRTTVAEAGVLVAVLLVTGFLVDRSPEPDVVVTSPSAQGQSGDQSVELDAITADLTLDPLAVGPTTITITLTDDAGRPTEGYEAPRLSLSTTDVDLGEVTLTNQGPGTYAGDLVLPTGGTWEVQVSLRTSEFDNPVKTVRFEVP